MTPSFPNKKPHFRIRVKTSADIVESGCGINLDQAVRIETEKKLEQQLKQNIMSVIDKAQNGYHSDFMKFGDVFRNKYPAEWRSTNKNWDLMFAKATFDVEVKASIKSGVVKAVGTEIR